MPSWQAACVCFIVFAGILVIEAAASCPTGWYSFNESCYFFETDSTLSFLDAESACNSQYGGSLTTIDSSEEENFLKGFMNAFNTGEYPVILENNFWIGLYDNEYWIDGTDSAYRLWADGEPAEGTDLCSMVCISCLGKWHNVECTDELNYACEVNQEVVELECPEGYAYNEGSCYKLFTSTLNFDDAQAACEISAPKVFGGHLAVVTTESENKFLQQMVAAEASSPTATNNSGVAWIGFEVTHRNSSYHWIDGTVASYTNWNFSEPSLLNYGCAAVSEDGLWESKSCFGELYFICEVPIEAEDLNCPWDYVKFDGMCYKVYNEDRTFSSASAICQADGMNLATVPDSNAQSFLKNKGYSNLQTYFGIDKSFWIGLTDTGASDFYWLDGSNSSYRNWMPDNPEVTGQNVDCVAMSFYDEECYGKWANYDCYSEMRFICAGPPADYDVCPPRYVKANDMCIGLNAELEDQETAEEDCAATGAHLVTIRDLEDQTAVEKLVADYLDAACGECGDEITKIWIGLYSVGTNFQWLDGTNPHYTNWADDVAFSNEDSSSCVYLSPVIDADTGDVTAEWEKGDCTEEIPSICAVEIMDSATIQLTPAPTGAPSLQPSLSPSEQPSIAPTQAPSFSPSLSPTHSPTAAPTLSPSQTPTLAPTKVPSLSPTSSPTEEPTEFPTAFPTTSPTEEPTAFPTASPTSSPTEEPTALPTASPTSSLTEEPTAFPTASPTFSPTEEPTAFPTASPTSSPTGEHTAFPTTSPTPSPSSPPTAFPTITPNMVPTRGPTASPTLSPSMFTINTPTQTPSHHPTAAPTVQSSAFPTKAPTLTPTSASPTTESFFSYSYETQFIVSYSYEFSAFPTEAPTSASPTTEQFFPYSYEFIVSYSYEMEPSASPTPAFVPGPVSCDDCPNGYEKFGNMCLRGYTTKMNMTSAEAECEAFGAHLVSIHDPEEEDYLEEFLSEYIETQSELIDNHDKNFWIGLGLDTETMDRFWTDGSTFLYDNWLEGHENDVSQQCAVVAGATKRLGKWNDKGCSSLYYPICMYPYVSCESSHSPHYSIEYSYFSIEYSYSWEHSYHMGEYSYYEEEYSYSYLWEYSYFMEEYSYSFDVGCGSCPKGFSKYGDGCFTTFAESVDRDTAQSLCEEVGSKLATIDTQRTQDEVEDFLFELVEETQDWTRKTQLNFWIGLKHEPAGSEQYKWADGASHTSNFYNWYSNNADKQDCTTISTVSKKFGMWNDKGCQTLARPLCASEMTKASCPTKAATSAPGTTVPTASPTAAPTAAPAASPTLALTSAPTASPSGSPSLSPTAQPTASPSGSPSISPTAQPTAAPSGSPSLSPTAQPTAAPSGSPSLSPTAQPTGVPCGRCPADFSKFGGSCLKAFTDLKNKKSAERQCRSLGARLVSVRDCDQEAYLMEYLHYHLSTHSHLNSNGKKFWMDLELLENGSDFGWGDGTPFEYSHWPVTFAGPDSSQPCATMSGQIQSLGEWGTASCLELFAPFCEYEFESCEPGQQTDQPQFVPEVPTPLPTTSSGTPVEDFWSFSFSYSFEFLMPGMDPSTLDDELDDEDDQEECPPGFALYGELCLKGFVAPKNFLDAESSCRMLGATLVGIHSEAEDALVDLYLREFLNMNPNLPGESHVWIGLFKEENGKYGWTDGTPLGYDRWDSGRNQDDIAKSCTAVTKDEQGRSSWNSKHCHAENTYICSVYSEKSQPRHASKPVDLPLHFPMGSGDEQKEKPTPGIPCTGCPKGYQQSGDHCLKFYADSATMDEAESVCGADKAHLASIHSAEEQEGIYEFVDSFLTSNFVPDFQRGFWLGSTLNEDGILGWTDGTELNYFFARAPGTEDFGCTVVSGFMEGRRWQGKDCNSHASALCMRPPVCDIHGGNTQTDMAAAKTGDAHPVSAEMIIPARHLFLDGSASKHGQSIRLVDTSGTYGSASIPMALSRSLGFLSNTFILDFDLTISSPEERSECGDTFVLNLGNNKESSCADPEKNLHDASCNAIGLALVSNSDVTFPGVKSYVNGVVESVFPYTALFENKKTHIRVEFRPEGAMCNIQYFFDEKNIFGQSFEHFDEAAFENTHAEIQFSARSREECSALYEISDVVITTEKEFSTFEKQMFLMYMELENPALLWEFAEYDLMQRGVMSSLVEIYPNEKVHDAEGWQNTSALRARLVGVGSATLFIGAILYLKRMRNNRYGSYSPL